MWNFNALKDIKGDVYFELLQSFFRENSAVEALAR